MRFLRQSMTGVFLAALTLALLVYAGQIIGSALETRMAKEVRAPSARERVFAVNVVTATPQRVSPALEAFGQIQSRRMLELRATTGGRVVWLEEHFEEGGTVETGEVLVRIDPSDAQAGMDRAKSDRLDAQAEVRDAKRSLALARDEHSAAEDQSALRERAFKRQKDLQERGVGTATTVEVAELAAASARQAVLARRISVAQAESRVDQAGTRLARAQITMTEAERELDDTEIRAGFGGTLSEVDLVEGRLVSANEKLAKIIDPNALEVAFRVSTAQYARLLDDQGRLIKATMSAALDMSGVDLIATGRISRDSIGSGEGQSGRLLFAHLDQAPGFKPGDFVTVSVQEPAIDNVVRLPASALDAGGIVLVVNAEDRLETLQVVLVRRQGDDVLVRGDGLAGREVVTGRTPLLGAGIKVRPLRAAMPEGQGEDKSAAVLTPDAEMLALSDERRAKLRDFVQASERMPKEAKERVLTQLDQPTVPARLVQRIESRMGG